MPREGGLETAEGPVGNPAPGTPGRLPQSMLVLIRQRGLSYCVPYSPQPCCPGGEFSKDEAETVPKMNQMKIKWVHLPCMTGPGRSDMGLSQVSDLVCGQGSGCPSCDRLLPGACSIRPKGQDSGGYSPKVRVQPTACAIPDTSVPW